MYPFVLFLLLLYVCVVLLLLLFAFVFAICLGFYLLSFAFFPPFFPFFFLVVCGLLIPWPGVRPRPLGWECCVQDDGPLAWYIQNDEREKPKAKNTLPSKALIQIWRRNQKVYRQAKAKRIQHHQTSSTRNAKGTSLGGKHERRKNYENKLKTIKKMVIGTYI